jgi:hypothetical protein
VAVLSRKFFGSAATEGAAFAFGAATAPVLSPALESVRQQAWKLHSVRIPETAELAAAVAQEKLDLAQAEEWAARNGFSPDVFGTLVTIARTAPDVGTAMQAWRRGEIDLGGFNLVLARHGIDGQWWQALQALKLQLLSPGELAAAIHRGLVPDPGLLKGEQPTGPFKVEAYPVYDIPTLDEAAGSGFDRDRLGVLVGLQGLPMGTHEAAQAYFRGIITHGDYVRAFNESNSRNEWAEAVLGYSRQIPTARDFLENALRGYRTLDEAISGAALHGMTPEHATMIYQNQGRPMTVANITKALARGGKFQPEPGEIKDPYQASIVEGSIKPAYYDLLKALRYSYPSAFFMRGLVQSGHLTAAEFEQYGLEQGWRPDLAKKIADSLAPTTTTASDPHIGKAQTQLWNTTHSSYVNREISDTQARNALGTAGVQSSALGAVLSLWQAERDLVRKQLTPAQVKKALAKGSRNAATGQPWTRDEALAWLVAAGYSANDANDFLDIP